MSNIEASKRFIDDGCGVFRGTKRQFTDWINRVNSLLATYGLNIDEYSFSEPGHYVSFLDIKFCFDPDGVLQTKRICSSRRPTLDHICFSEAATLIMFTRVLSIPRHFV